MPTSNSNISLYIINKYLLLPPPLFYIFYTVSNFIGHIGHLKSTPIDITSLRPLPILLPIALPI